MLLFVSHPSSCSLEGGCVGYEFSGNFSDQQKGIFGLSLLLPVVLRLRKLMFLMHPVLKYTLSREKLLVWLLQ